MLSFEKINVLADICTNHHGDEELFLEMCKDIEAAGAIVKIQLFDGRTFPLDWMKYLEGRIFVPSVFRPSDVDLVAMYQPAALKIASVEATYWELINECLQTHLPLIISTGGMSEDEFIELADRTMDESERLCFMHCVSEYPTPLEHANLERLDGMAGVLDDLDSQAELGYSCHNGQYAPDLFPIALALGATQFELHVRSHRWVPQSPDELCAITAQELPEVAQSLELARTVLGDPNRQFVTTDRESVLEWRKRWMK